MGLFRRKRPPTPEELLAAGRESGADAPPVPSGDLDFTVEDIFVITGRGVVATGRIGSGSVTRGQTVRVSRDGVQVHTLEVAGIEMFRRIVTRADAGENVGLLFKGIARADLLRGDVIGPG